MFEDILNGINKNKSNKSNDVSKNDYCPNCGSDDIGLTEHDNKVCFFCADCGYIWDCA